MPIEYLVVRCYGPSCGMFQVLQKKKTNRWECKICHEKQSVRKVYGQSYRAKDLREVVQKYNMDKGNSPPSPSQPDADAEARREAQPLEVLVENNTPRENKWSNYLRQQAQEAEEEEDDDTPFTTCFPDYQPMSKKRRTTATAATTGDSFAAHARGRGRFGRGRGWRGCVAGIRSSSQDTDGHYSSPSHADDTRQLNGRGGNGGKHSATRWSYRPSVTIKGFGKGGPSMDQASTNTLILQREISTEDNEKQDEARSIPLSQTTLHLKAAPKSSYVMLASPGSASALPASQSLTPSSRSSSCLGSRWSAYQNQDQEDDQDEETSAPKSRLGNGGLKRPTLDLRLFSTSSISFGDDEVVEEERM